MLRPDSSGTYTMLGEAYVHGAMDGELIKNGIAGPPHEISIV